MNYGYPCLFKCKILAIEFVCEHAIYLFSMNFDKNVYHFTIYIPYTF